VCTREIDGGSGKAVEFGTSGYTMDHIFVLYDRETDSVWYPLGDGTFDAVAGEREGRSLDLLDEPAPVPLGEWLDDHPATAILLPTPEDLETMRRMARRPYLGVQLASDDGEVAIREVVEGAPAEAAGLRAGDRIVRLDDRPITSRADLREVLSEHEAGETIEIVVERDGEEVTLELTLGSRG
jgi:membrane-associated protease RseP (regulator of RpoE activity)